MDKAAFKEVPAYFMVPDGCGHWISEGQLVFYSKKFDYEITVPAYTVNDLASIPVMFRRVFNVNGPSRPAAALHDYLYGTKGLKRRFTRAECDSIFIEAMSTTRDSFWKAYPVLVKEALTRQEYDVLFENNQAPIVPALQAKCLYLGVRLGGGLHFD